MQDELEDIEILRESKRKYSTLLDNLPGMVYRCGNDKDWTMEFLSQGCFALTGYLPEELIHNNELSYNEVILEEDRKKVWQAVQRGVENRQAYKIEYRIITKDGIEKWVWEQGQGIYTEDGEILALEGFITDITEKVKTLEYLTILNEELEETNQLLRESERKYSTLLDNLPGMVYRCLNDENWTMEYISDGCEAITGYKADELIMNRKLSYNDIIHPDDRDKVWDWVQEAVKNNKPFEMRYRYRIITENGTTRWVWEKGRAVYDNRGEFFALEGFITDITDLVHKDQLLRQAQKMETIGTLASGLAHDFNNILGGVTGSLSLLSNLLSREVLTADEKIKLYLQTATDASHRGAELVKQLLTLSRKIEPVYARIDINKSIDDVIKICKNSFPKEVTINYTRNDRPVYINGDANQIEQTILNICINASQAMTVMRPPGEKTGGILSVGVELFQADSHFCEIHTEAEDDLEYVAISIRDTGVGIDSKDKLKIFEPFYTTKAKGKGTGLGLSMVYYISKQHNGFFDVYSEVDTGTTFTLFFPVMVPDEDTGSISVVDREIFTREGTVLIVDDEELMRVVIKGLFEDIGYQVINSSSGYDAIKIYRKQHDSIDLIFLDLSMPDISGEEVLTQLRRINPAAKCVISSGYCHEERKRELFQKGALYFLQKPFTSLDVIRMLSEIT